MNDPDPTRLGAGLRLPFDPLLALATLGLLVMSLLTLDAATRDDIPGDPHRSSPARASTSSSVSPWPLC